MANRRALFAQADVARAIRGARAAGIEAMVEVRPDGAIRIIPLSAVDSGDDKIEIEAGHEVIDL